MKLYLATVLLLIITFAGHTAIIREQDRYVPDEPVEGSFSIPSLIGEFEQYGSDQEISDRVRRVLQTEDILMRTYRGRSGWPVYLTIVQASNTRSSLHFPEVCLVGAGWELREQYSSPVGFSFTAKHLILEKGNEQEAVLYWFKTGERFTGSFFLNSWFWAKEKMMFGTPKSAMIKLSTFVGPMGQDAAFEMLEDLALRLAPIILQELN